MPPKGGNNSTAEHKGRPLPLPEGLAALGGRHGQKIFREALFSERDGNLRPFFPLIQELITQETESFCGVASMLTILNSLGVDPGRSWTPDVPDWDWYGDVTMLKGISTDGVCNGGSVCCIARELIEREGMCLNQWECVARANGLDVEVRHVGDGSPDDADDATVEDFRAALRGMSHSEMMLLNFNRQGVGQVGGGHFSPIGGYNSKRDMVLVLDVARFKYVPWWAPVEDVFDSMSVKYGESHRGYAMVSVSVRPGGGVFPAEEVECE